MKATLIKTDGPWLEAEIAIGTERFIVMDVFSPDDRPARPAGSEFYIELSVGMLNEEESWEFFFASNPEQKKCLEHLDGWRYRAYGEILSINPAVVDCGLLQVEDVFDFRDSRVIGEFVSFTIDRLDAR
ncbi:hypothetical protein [Roseimicrobium sp. ORNL1]|uniref:hypothetical protein n=1 Tax=Roseimicrobium sp. ORNL1 TaxID=2711231 RepID=UPI0013E1FAF9|nr:hypothetical protein [Roseimicrobium sp. ORNL1]QIF01783.1 hypothetical protein G5S37_09675 [Roseimicrobium sp. ORNL1]